MQTNKKVIPIAVEVDYDDGTWHTCPYAEDINDDHETLCDCSADKTYECAMDI